MQSVSQIWNLHLHFQGFGWQPVLVFDTLLLLVWTCSNIVFWIRKIKLPADCYTTDRMYAWLYQSVTDQSVLEHVDNGDGLILPNAGNTQLCFICKLRYQPFVVRALLLYMWRVLTKKSLWSLHTQGTTEVSLSKQPHQL